MFDVFVLWLSRDSAGGNLATAAALAIRDEVFEVVLHPRFHNEKHIHNEEEKSQGVDERPGEEEEEEEGDFKEEVIGFLDPPAALILISPWLDLNNRGASFHTNAEYDYLVSPPLLFPSPIVSDFADVCGGSRPSLTSTPLDALQDQQRLSQAAADYLQGEQSSDPLCSPLFADDVQGLPHILCFSGEKELFCDDIRLFMDRSVLLSFRSFQSP